jgi:hypothetical protein
MGDMKRATAYEERERRTHERFASTLVIATAIIAAVGLAREDMSAPSPRVLNAVFHSVNLTKMILQKVVG